ncbi:MAG: hypothetical protein HZC51_09960 [Nitrospirae bacterium]|nr:hypothetical protein [Nitrospirota bacterium]
MKQYICFALLFLLITSPICAQAAAGKVAGKVVLQTKPVEGAFVYAYKDPAGLFAKLPDGGPVVTGPDGTFAMELPRGKYYIAAKKKGAGLLEILEPGDFYSFYGGNPVEVEPGRPAEVVLNLAVKPASAPDTDTNGGRGGVEGVATLDGEPLDGVVINVYLDPNEGFRGMGYYMSPPTGVDGRFRLKMEEGTYYIVARKRLSGNVAGPLQEGDYFGYLETNPVVMKKGALMHVTLPLVKKTSDVSAGGHGKTLVKGVIRDINGAPVSGAYACLYKEPEMLNRPAYVSKPTGADGAFAVEAPVGGVYYLGARDAIGGPVEPGQLWGRYNGTEDHAIKVETGGTVEGLTVTVEKVE